MFSRQVNRLDELRGLMPDRAIEILRDVLGRSNGVLRHDGPVILAAPSGGEFGDNEVPDGSDMKFNGRALGTIKWGEAVAASTVETDAATAKQSVWVDVQERDDQYGNYAAGYKEQGGCEKWFCSTSTGETISVLLAPTGSSDVQAAAGDMIPFSYGLLPNGENVAIAVGAGVRGGRAKLRCVIADGDWAWVVGQEGKIGWVVGLEVDDVFGNNPGSTGGIYYLPDSPGHHPNIHRGDVFSWMEDEDGNRVAVDRHLDARIGDVKEVKPGEPIPRGWRQYTEAAGRFVVGWGLMHQEYYQPGSTGGSHPIRPAAHDSSSSSKQAHEEYRTDYTGHWYKQWWNIESHTPTGSGAEYADFTIQPVALYADTTKLDGLYTSEVNVAVKAAQTDIEIAKHGDDGKYPPEVSVWVDAVGHKLGPDDGWGQTEITDAHYHDIALGFDAADLRHQVTDPGHDHETENHFHTVEDTMGHGHSITPRDHTHGVLQYSHRHGLPDLDHTGALYHMTEDYRPPWRVAKLIIRVGPDED